MPLASPAFSHRVNLPDRYTCRGHGVSPPLVWTQPSPQTRSQMIIMFDSTIQGKPHYHWVLYNIPVNVTEIGEGQTVGQVGLNSAGQDNYEPPCPQRGQRRQYIFHLYELDTVLPTTVRDILSLMNFIRQHTLAISSMIVFAQG